MTVRTPRIARRRVLAVATMMSAGGALALAGCGDGDRDERRFTAMPRRTLRIGSAVPLSHGLDPHVETATGLAIIARMYGYLFHVDSRDDSLILDHAAGVEQPDATTYVITLRGDNRFHDTAPASGRVVTAEDARQSMLRYRDNSVVTETFWHRQILDSVEASSPTTLVVKTKRPYIYSLAEMGGVAAGAILPAEVAVDRIDISAGGAGSGPLALASYERERIRLRRFGAFSDPIDLEGMDWTIYPSHGDKVDAFNAGAIDMMPNANRAEADLLAAQGGVDVTHTPSLAWTSLGMRVDRSPFTDPRIREAIDLAIDRAALVDAIDRGAGLAPGPVNAHLANGYWSLSSDEVDDLRTGGLSTEDAMTQSRRLTAAAGVSGATVRIQVPKLASMLDLAELVRAQLQRIDLKVVIVAVDQLQWFLSLRRGDFDVTLVSHLPYETPDPGLRHYHAKGNTGEGNEFGFADPEIDRLLEASWSMSRHRERREALRDVQRRAMKARSLLQLHSGVSYETARNYVKNRQPELPGSLALYHARQRLEE